VKHMISMQRKLLNVEKVDPLEVSYLVLAGIINILAQHDRIEEIDEKLKDVQFEMMTSLNRLELLEN